jgi:hypothetical protein
VSRVFLSHSRRDNRNAVWGLAGLLGLLGLAGLKRRNDTNNFSRATNRGTPGV